MEFEDSQDLLPWSQGPIAALVAAGYTAITTLGSAVLGTLALGVVTLDGGISQGDTLVFLAIAVVCMGLPALIDGILAAALVLLATRVRRSRDPTTLMAVLLGGVVWSVVRLLIGFITFSCMAIPANLLSLVLFGGAAMMVSLDASLKQEAR